MQNTWFSFSHFNIRSVCTGFSLFSDLVLKEKFIVISLSETWLDNKIKDNSISIDGYKLIRKDHNRRGGGVAVYIYRYINYKVLDVPDDVSLEQLWISLKTGGKKFCLGTLYSPPNATLTHSLEILVNTLSKPHTRF